MPPLTNEEIEFGVSFADAQHSTECRQCGKAIKRPYYYMGQGPYGYCCYKKIVGDSVRKRISVRKPKVAAGKLCGMGLVKDCKNCLIWDVCDLTEKERKNV